MVIDGIEINECDIIESLTGYSCPNCGCISSDKSLKHKSETEFDYFPDPHYKWIEIHECVKCDTIYSILNGT